MVLITLRMVWKMPVGLAVNSVALGACFGLFPIVWIVITAVWVYNMTVESGEFEIIKDSLARLTDDRRLQALFIAFAFSCFIEGTAGFGTPVAIAAAMLVGLGFTPLWGAGIALIANTAPVAFGAIGVPLIVAAQVSGLDQMTVSAIAGRQLPLLSLIVPLWVCVVMCGFKRSMEVLPAIIVAGVAFGGAQFLLANSITLTPGTVTVALHRGRLCVYALDQEFAAGVKDSEFVRRLRRWEGKQDG